MAYLFFLLANAALFIRPAELFPQLGNIQAYLYLILIATVSGLGAIQNQLRVRTLMQQPINLCVLGVILAIILSHVSNGQLVWAAEGAFEMTKVLVYYLLLVGLVNTTERLKQFLFLTALCSTFMISLSVLDYHSFVEEWHDREDLAMVREQEKDLPENAPKKLRHAVDQVGFSPDGKPQWAFRLCGFGMYHDPNDIALLIVFTMVISTYFLMDKRLTGIRFLWFLPMGLMLHALLMTHSRGGLLAMGVAGLVWLATKYGGKLAIGIGSLGALAVPLALGRQGNLEVSGGTGQQRIQLWADGLAQMKTMKGIFGIGQNRYHEIAGLAAHNSYVHAFVELGFVGGMFFFGCFLFIAWSIYRIKKLNLQPRHPELQRLLPYVAAMVAGWCMGMTTLSRCYVPPTYMVIGSAAAYLNLTGYYQLTPRPLLVMSRYVFDRWVLCSAALLVACFAFVKLFVRYG